MPRKTREANATYLERVALWYMERYPASEARVRRALGTRVARSVAELGTDPVAGAQAVEEVVAKLVRLGLLNDLRLAAARVRTLRGRGLSTRRIHFTLRHQGIASGVIDEVLAGTEAGDDLAAARTFVRKRRMGPHRVTSARSERRAQDLARLARAGFPYAVAGRVLDESLDDGE